MHCLNKVKVFARVSSSYDLRHDNPMLAVAYVAASLLLLMEVKERRFHRVWRGNPAP